MTDKEKVRQVYARACANASPISDGLAWSVFSEGWFHPLKKLLGEGQSEVAAWADAWRRIQEDVSG